MQMVRMPVLLALSLFGLPAAAIGPEAPVDFVDVYAAKGFMLMVVESDQVVDIELTRVIHQDGEPLVREKVDWQRLRMIEYTTPLTGPDAFQYRDPRDKRATVTRRTAPARVTPLEAARPLTELRLATPGDRITVREGPPRRVGVLIPLETPAQGGLKDGIYAEKFTARVRQAGESEPSKPLTMQRWSHFIMTQHKPRLISQAAYSRIVDPPQQGIDGAGAKIQLNVGRDVKADVPIEKTERHLAFPLQRHADKLVPERDDSLPCGQVASDKRACNEANER